jgi:WD40 repeat protein
VTQAALAPERTVRLPQSPYKGLLPFTAEDSDFFFGREVERELIAANLMAARLTVLYGPSGVGKTSVLDAGVAHDLTKLAQETVDEEDTPNRALVVFRTWHGDPAEGLLAAVAESVQALFPDQQFDEPPPEATLVDTLAHWTRELDGRLLIVLDQFEEYFVYAGTGGRFDEEFPRAVNRADLRANFLISIREDALAKLDRFKGRIPYLFDNYLRLDRLDPKAARLAIEGPLRRWAELGGDAVSIEEELVAAVLEEVRPDLGFGQAGTGTANTERPDRIETTFLQLVMTKLWETERERASSVLRLATLKDLGGAKGIVRAHLNEGLDLLSANEKGVAAHLFQFLVTRSGQKVAHTAVDLADFSGHDLDKVTPVLDRLSRRDAWILRRVDPAIGEEARGSLYEIYHDTLGEPILEWRSAHLQRMHEREANERARRAIRRASLWAGAAVVVAACLVLLLLAIQAKRSADAAKRTEHSQKLVRESAEALTVDPAQAVRLADDALAVKQTPEAETALRRAVGLSPLRMVIRHGGEVPRAEYTKDGRRVFAVGAEGTASISDARTGRRLTTIGYGKPLSTGDISLDGRRVMTASAGDDTVRFWDARSGAQLASFRNPHLIGAWLDRADGREAVATSSTGWVRIWRLGAGRPIAAHLTSNALLHAAFSPDGRRVVVSGFDPTAWIVDARTGRVLHVLSGHTRSIDAVAWSPDGRLVATGGDDYYVHIWNAATGRSTIEKSWPNSVSAVAFDAAGKKLAIASGTRIYVIDTDHGTQLAELRGHTDVINDVEFRTGRGRILVTASYDGTARVWDFADYTETTLRILLGHRSIVDTAVFSPDGRSVLTGGADGTARIWNVATGRELWGHYSWVLAAAFSPDGKRVVTGGRDLTLRLWNADTGKLLQELPDPPASAVANIRVSGDGKLVAVAENGGDVTVRRTSTWETVTTIQRGVPVAEAVFSPDAKSVAIASFDGWTGIFDARSGYLIRWLSSNGKKIGPDHPHGNATGVAWSSDGRFLATTSSDGTIHVWSPQGRFPQTLLSHAGQTVSPSFAPHSDLLLVAGADHTARIWNAATGQPVAVLADDPEALTSAAFSPNGRLVVTGDAGGLTQVWDWSRKQLLAALPMHSDFINAVSFSPDGKRILSASNDSTAKIYGCETCISLRRLDDLVRRRERILAADRAP